MTALTWFRDEWRDPDVRRRAISVALALAIEIIIFLMLLFFGDRALHKPAEQQKNFRLIAVSDKPSPKEPAAKGQKSPEKHSPPPAQAKVTTPRPPVTPPLPPPPVEQPALLKMNSAEMASSDISKLHGDSGAGDSAGGSNGGAAYGPGAGPGGARLFNAEWYREPRDAELAHYLPPAEPGAWADIACKTIEAYHVENCRSLGESPPGSGLARGLREAAWQFLVRPPRVNGKAQIGAWVRIHFDFTRAPKDKEPDERP